MPSSLTIPALNNLASDVFVGREREMAVLRTSLEETLVRKGRVVVLLGEPGIGKTRLVTELLPYAQEKGLRALVGRCPDGDGAPPYWPWLQIVRAYVSECSESQLHAELEPGAADLAQVIPAIRERLPGLAPPPRLEPQQERFRFFDNFTTFFRNMAKRCPLLLVLDDLQWADAPSLLFLQFLIRELTDTKLLLVITCRDSEAVQQPLLSQTLAAIARASGSQTLSLSGLTYGEVTQFLELTTGQPPTEELRSAVFQRTEGHPFFMTEVVRLLSTEQAATLPGTSSASLPVLPPTVRSVIEQRLATVSSGCRQILAEAAVIGREFRLQVLEAITRLQEKRIVSSALLTKETLGEQSETNFTAVALLDEALTARLVIPVPQQVGRYSFTHALIQETLYESISTIERLDVHRRIGNTLEMLSGDSVASVLPELAHHFFQAAQAGNEVDKAVSYATRAAEGATVVFAYEEAIAQYEHALQLLSFKEPDDELHCELRLALGKALNRTSDATAATRQFQQAADLARTRKLSHQLAHAALGLAGTRIPISGPNPDILQLLQEALALLPHDTYALRARLLARLAKELTYSDSYEQREQYSQEAVTLARRTADPYALAAALCDHCIATWRPDTLDERLATSLEIMALAEQLRDPELFLFSRYLRIANALEHDNILTIYTEIAGFVRHMAEIQPPLYTWVWFHERLPSIRALLTGQFAEAEEQLRSPGAVLPGTLSTSERERLILPQFLILRREQGQLQEPGLETILKHAVEHYPALSALRCALAYVRAELGREAEARAEFEYWAAHNFTTVPQRQDRLVTFAYLAELCTAWGDTTRARQLYEILLPYAERNVIVGTALGYFDTVAHLLGKLATVLGHYDQAQGHFEFALQRNLRMGARPRFAHTQYSYACMLLARNQKGDEARAIILLDQALATAHELGMPGLVDDIQSSKPRAHSKASRESRVQSLESINQPPSSIFRCEGDYWTITYQGIVLRLKDTTGLQYLSQLLKNPEQEFHVLDLIKSTSGTRFNSKTIPVRLEAPDPGDAGDVLDSQARAAYKRRLEDLRDELAEAQSFNDVARVGRLEQEVEFLTQELASAYGLSGRQRKAASAAQRARVNVTLSIKNVLKKIDKQNPPLALYFSTTIKTGTFCSYTPDPRIPVTWEF